MNCWILDGYIYEKNTEHFLFFRGPKVINELMDTRRIHLSINNWILIGYIYEKNTEHFLFSIFYFTFAVTHN